MSTIAKLTHQVLEHIVTQAVHAASISGQPRLNGYHHLSDGPAAGLDYVTLASTTEGYSIADLHDLVSAASQQSIIRSAKNAAPNVSGTVCA